MRRVSCTNYGRWQLWTCKGKYAIEDNNGKPQWDIGPHLHTFSRWFRRKLYKEYTTICSAAELWSSSPFWRTMTLRQFLIKSLGPPPKDG